MKTTVRIESPVKVDGKIYMPGEHEVDAETRAALEGFTASPAPAEEPAPAALTADEIDRQVAERAEVIAKTLVEGAVERATADLTRERDEAVARAKAAEDRLAVVEAGASNSAPENSTAAAPAAPTPKKGGKAKEG